MLCERHSTYDVLSVSVAGYRDIKVRIMIFEYELDVGQHASWGLIVMTIGICSGNAFRIAKFVPAFIKI